MQENCCNPYRDRTANIFSLPEGAGKDISKDVRAIKEAADLPADFRPLHGLRHVYATMLANSGKVDMFTLQKLMTHKSPQMTQRYAHYRDEAMQRASNEVSGILEDALSMRGEDQRISRGAKKEALFPA